MENIKELTSIEIVKRINDSHSRHERLKDEIITLTNDLERICNEIDIRKDELVKMEEIYVKLVGELYSRKD